MKTYCSNRCGYSYPNTKGIKECPQCGGKMRPVTIKKPRGAK